MSQPITFISEERFSQTIDQLEQSLWEQCRHGHFQGEDGKPIYYEYWTCPNPEGSVVVVHGMSEFTKKYYELTHYLLTAGYNVFLYDQRGHGLSHRDTDRPELLHINSFDQLVSDLECYLEQVVCKAAEGPLYLYAHSMGGAVGALHLAQHPGRFRRAVLTSPLIAPRMNDLPALPFLIGVTLRKALVGDLKKFRLSGEYVPHKPYVPAPGDSPARVCRCLWHRDRERRYQSTPMTLGCVYQSLRLRKKLLKGSVAPSITTPTLMLCADHDAMVKPGPQAKFAAQCSAITRQVLPGSNHNLLTDCQPIVEQTLRKVLSFYEAD